MANVTKKKKQGISKSQAAEAVGDAFDALVEAHALFIAAENSEDKEVLSNVADEKLHAALDAMEFADDYFNQKAA